MDVDLKQIYGPIKDEAPDLEKYLYFSEQAFLLTSQLAGDDPEIWGTTEGRVFQLLMLHAVNTSYSVRLLTTFAQSLEAYALLRVRLEQLIVCSYLIHSDPDDGLIPYIQDIDRTDYRAVKALDCDAELKDMLQDVIPHKFKFAKVIAELNEKSIDPDFDIENDRIRRKWTKLNTHDLALHRDKHAPDDDDVMSVELRRYYLTLYKSASIIVHSDSGTLTENFLQVEKKGQQPTPPLLYTYTNIINCIHFDILQCYEILHHLGVPKKRQLLELNDEFHNFLESQI